MRTVLLFLVLCYAVAASAVAAPPLTSTYPTRLPSDRPTAKPTTLYPTGTPTRLPTTYPATTPFPTGQPTVVPIFMPTKQPSAYPTKRSTSRPTSHPSKLPTLLPTALPTTLWPTKRPTDAPSLKATQAPTPLPTFASPTPFPTHTPTAQPSMATATPTQKPTSASPTVKPTQKPSSQKPTMAPTTGFPPPNILLLIADDFKPISRTYGERSVGGIKMENLDRISRDGITFRNAHCQMSVCGPSRASFLSSLRPDTTQVLNLAANSLFNYWRKPQKGKRALLLPQLFKLQGYMTIGVGKVLHEAETTLMGSEEVWSEPMYTASKWTVRPPSFTKPYVGSWIMNPDVGDDEYADGQAARLSAALITDRLGVTPEPNTSMQPWFLAVGLWKPHLPWSAPKKYFDRAGAVNDYSPSYGLNVDGLTRAQQNTAYGSGCGEVRLYDGANFVLDQRKTTEANLQQANHAYHATSLYMDAQMGIVLDALEQSHSRMDTIVVFLGDHGFHLGDHGLYGKHTNFEQATKVPFMIRPAMRDNTWKRGTQSFAPVELLDLMPTLYEMAGLSIDRTRYQTWEGVSLLPTLFDPANAFVKAGAISQYFRGRGRARIMGYTVRTTRFRLTKWANKFNELYDYADEGFETKIVKDAQKQSTLLAALQNVIAASKTGGAVISPFDFGDRFVMEAKPPTSLT